MRLLCNKGQIRSSTGDLLFIHSELREEYVSTLVSNPKSVKRNEPADKWAVSGFWRISVVLKDNNSNNLQPDVEMLIVLKGKS